RYQRAVGRASRTAVPRLAERPLRARPAVAMCASVATLRGRLDACPGLGAFWAVVRGIHRVLELGERIGGWVDDRVVLDGRVDQRGRLVVGMREQAERDLARRLCGLRDPVEECIGGIAMRSIGRDRVAVDPELATVAGDDVLRIVGIVPYDLHAVAGPRDREPR